MWDGRLAAIGIRRVTSTSPSRIGPRFSALRSLWRTVLVILLIAGWVGAITGPPAAQSNDPISVPYRPHPDGDSPTGEPPTGYNCWLEHGLSKLYDRVSPSVVSVVSYRTRVSYPAVDLDVPPRVTYNRLIASGVVLGEHGCVVTTAMAAQPGDSITVHFPSGEVIPAVYKGMDVATHVAVLNLVRGDGFPFLRMPERTRDELPNWVAAVAYGPWSGTTPGAPSLTLAEADAIDRIETHFGNRRGYLWRITAPIYPGNGGGALVNLRGDWIGLISGVVAGERNLASSRRLPHEAGVIVPAERVREAVMEIEGGERPRRGFLGVRTHRQAEGNGDLTKGIVVTEVLPESPAQRYGILEGDHIVRFKDEPIRTASELTRRLEAMPHGEKVEIDLLRDGRPRTVRLVLGDRDAALLFISAKRQLEADVRSVASEIRRLESRADMLRRRLDKLQSASAPSESVLADSLSGAQGR